MRQPLVLYVLKALTVVKVVLIFFSGPFEWYEFAIMITSMLISFISYCCVRHSNITCWIASIVNAIVVGIMEMARDVNMAKYSENDGKGCPLI